MVLGMMARKCQKHARNKQIRGASRTEGYNGSSSSQRPWPVALMSRGLPGTGKVKQSTTIRRRSEGLETSGNHIRHRHMTCCNHFDSQSRHFTEFLLGWIVFLISFDLKLSVSKLGHVASFHASTFHCVSYRSPFHPDLELQHCASHLSLRVSAQDMHCPNGGHTWIHCMSFLDGKKHWKLPNNFPCPVFLICNPQRGKQGIKLMCVTPSRFQTAPMRSWLVVPPFWMRRLYRLCFSSQQRWFSASCRRSRKP